MHCKCPQCARVMRSVVLPWDATRGAASVANMFHLEAPSASAMTAPPDINALTQAATSESLAPADARLPFVPPRPPRGTRKAPASPGRRQIVPRASRGPVVAWLMAPTHLGWKIGALLMLVCALPLWADFPSSGRSGLATLPYIIASLLLLVIAAGLLRETSLARNSAWILMGAAAALGLSVQIISRAPSNVAPPALGALAFLAGWILLLGGNVSRGRACAGVVLVGGILALGGTAVAPSRMLAELHRIWGVVASSDLRIVQYSTADGFPPTSSSTFRISFKQESDSEASSKMTRTEIDDLERSGQAYLRPGDFQGQWLTLVVSVPQKGLKPSPKELADARSVASLSGGGRSE